MRTAAAVLAVVSLSAVASAALDVPAFRGAPNTAYAGWESFTIAVGGDNAPDDAATTATGAFVRQTNPGAIIAGSGNIYSGFNVPNFEVGWSTGGDAITQLVLQVRTAGLELDYANVALDWTGLGGSGSILATRTELSRVSNGPQGATVESRFDFDLSGALFNSFVITLPSVDQLISLDRVELDASFVPAPAGAGLLAFTGLAVARRRRR